MDPLSLTASIIAVLGAGTQTAKLLKKLTSIQNAPALASALENELSSFRQTTKTIKDLINKQPEHASPDSQDSILSPDAIECMTGSLKQAEKIIVELDRLLKPLLVSTLDSESAALKQSSGRFRWNWIKQESRLDNLKRDLYNVRVSLNTTLGILGLSTSKRLETIARSSSDNIAKIKDDQLRMMRRLESAILTEQPLPLVVGRSQNESVGSQVSLDPRPSPQLRTGTTCLAETCLPGWRLALHQCVCCCHQRYSKRSSRSLNQIFGTLSAAYSGIPYLAPECNLPSCTRSCLIPSSLFSLTFFFPTWILVWAITLTLKRSALGFDYNIRLFYCVSYSSPIFQCAYQGNVSGMKYILQNGLGSPFDVTPEPQRTLLGIAASRGHGEICDILIHAGGDPFFADFKNRSAVDIAWERALTKRDSAIHLTSLLALSSYENYVLEYKLSLLHKTVLGLTHIDLKLMLSQISPREVNERDAHGQTALFWAAARGDSEIVSLLLAAGADCGIETIYRSTALTAAIISNDGQCVGKILEQGCKTAYKQLDGSTPLHWCCRYEHDIETIRAFLNLGADINAQEALVGYTPLMIAAFNKRTKVAKFLIDRQVDPNIQAKNGECALHHASMSGDHQTVHYLLARGADPHIKTKAGETLLHYAARRRGDQELVAILESFDLKGIDVEATNTSQKLTALQVAETYCADDVEWFGRFKALIGKIAQGQQPSENV